MYVQEAAENQISDDELEYFAARIDGDGSISCSYNETKRYLDKNINISSSTNLASLERIKLRLKNYDSYITKDTKRESNRRNAWRLLIRPKEHVRFLEQIKSHLVNKDRHAVLLSRIYKGYDIDINYRELKLINQRGKQDYILPENFVELYKSKIPKEVLQPQTLQPFTGKISKRPAYMAGSVDTDGSISMMKNLRNGKNVYALLIVLNSSTKEFYIDELTKMFHSQNMFSVHPLPAQNPNARNLLQVYVRTKYHVQFLKEVMPFMDTRLPQAETAMKYLNKEIDALTCYNILKEMNKRGKIAYNEVDEPRTRPRMIRSKLSVNINTKNNVLPSKKLKKAPATILDEYGIIR